MWRLFSDLSVPAHWRDMLLQMSVHAKNLILFGHNSVANGMAKQRQVCWSGSSTCSMYVEYVNSNSMAVLCALRYCLAFPTTLSTSIHLTPSSSIAGRLCYLWTIWWARSSRRWTRAMFWTTHTSSFQGTYSLNKSGDMSQDWCCSAAGATTATIVFLLLFLKVQPNSISVIMRTPTKFHPCLNMLAS